MSSSLLTIALPSPRCWKRAARSLSRFPYNVTMKFFTSEWKKSSNGCSSDCRTNSLTQGSLFLVGGNTQTKLSREHAAGARSSGLAQKEGQAIDSPTPATLFARVLFPLSARDWQSCAKMAPVHSARMNDAPQGGKCMNQISYSGNRLGVVARRTNEFLILAIILSSSRFIPVCLDLSRLI